MALRRIPCEVQSLITASARVNNFKGVIEELLYNSLDAESSSIAIRINLQKNWMQVVDNGYGITEKDFELLGERYATSKFIDINSLKSAPNKYGYRGQSLANIIEISESVKITSRNANSHETWIKVFVHGKQSEYYKTSARPSKGTTVEVSGFLFNLKIQRKSINQFHELDDVKRFLEQLLLIHSNVSISLRDDTIEEIIFKMHKHRDIYQTFQSLFEINRKNLQELHVQKNQYEVKAYIGIEGQDNLPYQWIYLNNKCIQNTSIHNLVNVNLSKDLDHKLTKYKKVKNKGDFNQEENVRCQCIPFYFIFITCPYFDYDIVYSNKQTVVEFKNWDQMKKLIETLIKFYQGDLNLKELPKNDNFNHHKNVQKIKNSRDDVKKIIEKILGKHDKKAQVSQMQKGVKGKQIRRKQKRIKLTGTLFKSNLQEKKVNNCNRRAISAVGTANLSLEYKTKPTNNIPHEQKAENSTTESKFTVKQRILKGKQNKVCKQNKNTTSRKQVIKKDNFKSMKVIKNCKWKQNNNDIIKQFKTNIDTVKRRCDVLSHKVEDFLKHEKCEKVQGTNIEIVQYSTITNKYCNMDNQKKHYSRFDHQSKLVSYKTNNLGQPITELKSYDLLQTILKTQSQYTGQYLDKANLYKYEQTSEMNQINCTPKQHNIRKLTFDSHKCHEINTVKSGSHKINKARKFITKESRNNFLVRTDESTEYGKDERDKISKNPTQFNAKFNKKSHNKHLNKHKNIFAPSFTNNIHISGSDIIGFSKMIRNKIIDDMNLLIDKGDHAENNAPQTEKMNIGVNFNIENTYTIVVDSIDHSFNALEKQVNNTFTSDKGILRNSYRNITNAVETYNSQLVASTRSEKKTHDIDKANIAIISETQEHSVNETIEPLKVCEVIYNSNENCEKEFYCKSGQHKRNDSLFSNECNENDPGEMQNSKCSLVPFNKKTSFKVSVNCKDDNNIEKNKLTSISNSIHEHTKNNIRYTTNVVPNDSGRNFELKSRRRFMPKGMSPIFEKCFSKNICSYNLGKDYYERDIYDNFANDVVVNSEIFQLKLQDIKELAAAHIQKATDRQRENNEGLIFSSESLRHTKVVLKQIDRKFIAAVIQAMSSHEPSEFLVLFDQHAVHERIRLEYNLSNYINKDHWRSATIDAIPLKMTKDKILYLHNHRDKFTKFGIEWAILNNEEILVNAIPEAIIGKHSRPVEVVMKTVKCLISEQIHAIKDLKGNVSLYPPSIMNLVFSEACRYAIKFGDQLSKKDCTELITALADCKTPFQCAHGRPVMAVMVELKTYDYQYKVNMEKLKQFKDLMKK